MRTLFPFRSTSVIASLLERDMMSESDLYLIEVTRISDRGFNVSRGAVYSKIRAHPSLL